MCYVCFPTHQQQSLVVVTETIWPVEADIYTILYRNHFAKPFSRIPKVEMLSGSWI